MTIVRSHRMVVPVGIALALVAALVIAPIVQAIAASPPERTAILARSDNPVDALAAGAVAAQAGGVVLLTAPAGLEPAAAQGLEQFDPDLVIIAGGTAALSQQVEADVQALGYQVERIGGTTRTDTARLLAERLGTLDKAYLNVEGTARNSMRLGNRGPSELTRADSSSSNEEVTLSTPVLPVAVLEIEAPTAGWLVLSGGANLSRPNADVTVICHLATAEGTVEGSVRNARLADPAVGHCQTGGRIPVDAGEHQVALIVTNPGWVVNQPNTFVRVSSRNVVAQFVPFDGTGETPPIGDIQP
jgi:hypothetical protein